MTRYFAKELPLMSFLPNGERIHVDYTDPVTSLGMLATSVGYVVQQIEAAIRENSGGWLESSEKAYLEGLENLKKKAPPQPKSAFRADRRGQSLQLPGLAVAGKTEVDHTPPPPKPEPIRVPTPEQMRPRVGPIPKEAFI